jgi:mono/diheme cytochrome c family protein
LGFFPHRKNGFAWAGAGSACGWTLLVPAFLATVIGGSFLGCQAKLTPSQAEGQHLYAVRCAHCHEENDLGLKPAPPDIHGVLQRAKLPSGAAATDAEGMRVVIAGKGKMPSFAGRFTEEQMAALLDYLHTSMR